MKKILIIYSSGEGQTKKIAFFIKEKIIQRDFKVDVFNCERISSPFALFDYDGVIIGAAVHRADFAKKLKQWIRENNSFLKEKPNAFFAVCLGILEKGQNALIAESLIVNSFFEKTEWYPKMWRIFAGALKYSRYNWFLKRFMRRIAKQAGFVSDMHKDYEFTDWKEVQGFVDQFLNEVISVVNKKNVRNYAFEETLE